MLEPEHFKSNQQFNVQNCRIKRVMPHASFEMWEINIGVQEKLQTCKGYYMTKLQEKTSRYVMVFPWCWYLHKSNYFLYLFRYCRKGLSYLYHFESTNWWYWTKYSHCGLCLIRWVHLLMLQSSNYRAWCWYHNVHADVAWGQITYLLRCH